MPVRCERGWVWAQASRLRAENYGCRGQDAAAPKSLLQVLQLLGQLGNRFLEGGQLLALLLGHGSGGALAKGPVEQGGQALHLAFHFGQFFGNAHALGFGIHQAGQRQVDFDAGCDQPDRVLRFFAEGGGQFKVRRV